MSDENEQTRLISRVTRLETSVSALENSVHRQEQMMGEGFSAISRRLDELQESSTQRAIESQRTPWGNIIAGFTLVALVLGAVGAAFVNPAMTMLAEHEADMTTLWRFEHESLQWRGTMEERTKWLIDHIKAIEETP